MISMAVSGISFITFLVFAIAGLMRFRDHVEDNVLNNYASVSEDQKSVILVAIAWLGM